MPQIALCLLGTGRWGKRYIETISGLTGVHLTAVASRNLDNAVLIPDGCRVYTDWRNAIAADDVDAVILATPPHLHAEMAIACIGAGKPVLIEKPLTLNSASARAVEKAAAANGNLVVIGHTHLFNPAFRTLKSNLSAVGSLRAINAEAGNWGPFRRDVTPIWDWAPHDLSMCLDILGRMPETINAECSISGKLEDGWGGNYRIRLSFPDVVTADISVGNMMPSKRRWIEVVGTAGSLLLDDIGSSLVLRNEVGDSPLAFPADRPLTTLILEFSDLVRHGCRSHSSLAMGCKIVEIIEACDRLTGIK